MVATELDDEAGVGETTVVPVWTTELPEGITGPLNDGTTELVPDAETGKEVGIESVFVFDGEAKLLGGVAYPPEEAVTELGPTEETGNEVGIESVLVSDGAKGIPPEVEGALYPLDEVPPETETASVAVESVTIEVGLPGRDAVTNTLDTGTPDPGLLIELMPVPDRLKPIEELAPPEGKDVGTASENVLVVNGSEIESTLLTETHAEELDAIGTGM
ncbi:hypothetical protein N0V83_008272 [Neocucurbitaria cava]|uniref:Uncharacterized protein n=1 Tax=Neocucurbitaria cava TaxID=798079 RepID=A0A9W8Y3K4_9PLEO|nr:hypothetical protein N0V83_008272 [Neocucurbitaria cava]